MQVEDIKPLEAPAERRALLTKIIETMPPGKKLSWSAYFETHPKEAALLGYKSGTNSHSNPTWNRNNVMATHMVRQGQARIGGVNRIANHPANVRALNGLEAYKVALTEKPKRKKRAGYTDADYKLAASIAEVYKRPTASGKFSVDWRAAFEKHPEWLEQLQGRRTDKALQAFLSRVRVKIAKGKLVADGNGAETLQAAQQDIAFIAGEAGHPSLPANGLLEGTVTKLTAENERLKGEIEFLKESRLRGCPRCLYNLEMHQRAYEIALKHSPK